MLMNTKILDCTLRDGGYYTNWDFSSDVVKTYIETANKLPVDYLEVGYRNKPTKEYMGKFGYTPVSILKKLRKSSNKKLAVMLNEKSTLPEDLDELLTPINGLADMVRLAVDPRNFERAVVLAKAVKAMGFEVAFNTMYMSKWSTEYKGFLDNLSEIDGVADLFCMVDSFGGITPTEVRDITAKVKANTTCAVGFHGHNNLQLGLINTLTAIECGVDFVDATALGMGRGAGNLNMELLLTYLKNEGLDVDFNVLGDYVSNFQPLLDKYQWGTNLPYMISGANRIPQKEVMEWVTNRAYSFNSIVRALDNKRNCVADNAHYPLLDTETTDKVLIIGGGNSAIEHQEAIKEYLKSHPNVAVIFVTCRHAASYLDIENDKYYCLVGNEAKRMKRNINAEEFNGKCVLAPFPRKMGTEVPDFAEDSTYELKDIVFTNDYLDSCTAIALQIALDLEAKDIFVIGYDGYKGEVLSEKEMDLTNENRTLFNGFVTYFNKPLISLTDTLYKELEVKSIYQFI